MRQADHDAGAAQQEQAGGKGIATGAIDWAMIGALGQAGCQAVARSGDIGDHPASKNKIQANDDADQIICMCQCRLLQVQRA